MQTHRLTTMLAAAVAFAAIPLAARQATPCQQQQSGPEMDALEAAVTKAEGVAASAKTLIEETAKYIRNHANDPTALQAFADRLTASSDSLATAVEANPDPDPND